MITRKKVMVKVVQELQCTKDFSRNSDGEVKCCAILH